MNSIIGQDAFSQFMVEANHIAQTNYGKFANFINAYKYVPTSVPPEDPNSDEYLNWQLDLWKEISGRASYTPQIDELDTNIVVATAAQQPFPFSTNDSHTIGNYLAAIGLIIKALELRTGDRVIEFGTGWGHTTLALARCGYQVTAMDIEGKFLEMLRQRAERESLSIETIQGEFLELPPASNNFDAALFFECFHHCINFKELLGKLHVALKPKGKIVFCAESFYGDWFDYPWGVRLDGHSVWAIRNFGWMELGFRETYIMNILEKSGYEVKKIENSIGAIGTIFVASALPK